MAEQKLEKQRPIKNELKSVRKVWKEPENPVRWAYAKILREKSKTRMFFPEINPYAEVYKFRDNIYGIYTHSLDGAGDPWMYIIDGPEKAMLVDTSFGVGDLKGLVEHLVGDKELYVVNTHMSYDHSYGNFQFERVYCHEYEAPNLVNTMRADLWDNMFDENGVAIWTDFDRADIVPFKEYEIVGVPNGYTWDLGGGYEIEQVFLPGHSNGHAAFLDRTARILFAGDDACFGAVGVGGGRPGNPHRASATVEALHNELVKLCGRLDEFDAIFPGHGPVDMGNIVLVNVMEACKAVLDDPTSYDLKARVERNGESMISYKKIIYQSGYLQYNSTSLFMDRRDIGDI